MGASSGTDAVNTEDEVFKLTGEVTYVEWLRKFHRKARNKQLLGFYLGSIKIIKGEPKIEDCKVMVDVEVASKRTTRASASENQELVETTPKIDSTMSLLKYQEALHRYKENNEKANKAMDLICKWVSDDILMEIENMDTAKEMYDHIQTQYGLTSDRIQLDVLSKLRGLKLEDTKDMSDYLSKHKVMRQDLKEAKYEYPDSAYATNIILGLPESYNGFKDKWRWYLETVTDKKVNPTTLHRKLHEEEELKLKQKNDRRKDNRQPNIQIQARNINFKDNGFKDTGYKDTGPRDNPTFDPNKKCTYEPCDKIGHTIDECWKKNKTLMPQYIKDRIASRQGNRYGNKPYSGNQRKTAHFAEGHNRDYRENDEDDKSKQPIPSAKISPDPNDSSLLSVSQTCAVGHRGRGDGAEKTNEVLTARFTNGKENVLLDTTSDSSRDKWYADTGANVTVVNDLKWFDSYKKCSMKINTEDNTKALNVTAIGTVTLRTTPSNKKAHSWRMKGALYSPEARCNLLSIHQFTSQHPLMVEFQKSKAYIHDQNGNYVMEATPVNGLYELSFHHERSTTKTIPPKYAMLFNLDDPVWKLHRALGHMSIQNMKLLADRSEGFPLTKKQIDRKTGQTCPTCATTRALVKIPRDPKRNKTTEKGDIIHVDTWGPYPVVGYDNSKYFIFMTDEFTRMTWGTPFNSKTEIPELFRLMIKKIETAESCVVKYIRVDNEFGRNSMITKWCEKNGKSLQTIVPHNHWSNGSAERVNRTLREKAAAMMRDYYLGGQVFEIIDAKTKEILRSSKIPVNLWPEAVRYAIWIKNRTPTRTLKGKITPWEAATKDKPNLTKERIFGSRAWVVIPLEARERDSGKLMHDRARLGYYVGRDSENIARIYFPDTHRVETANVMHIENGTGLDDPQNGESHEDTFPNDEPYMVEEEDNDSQDDQDDENHENDDRGDDETQEANCVQINDNSQKNSSSQSYVRNKGGSMDTPRYFANTAISNKTHHRGPSDDEVTESRDNQNDLEEPITYKVGPWTREDEELLGRLLNEGYEKKDISIILMRSIEAVSKKAYLISKGRGKIFEVESSFTKWSGKGCIPTERCHMCAVSDRPCYKEENGCKLCTTRGRPCRQISSDLAKAMKAKYGKIVLKIDAEEEDSTKKKKSMPHTPRCTNCKEAGIPCMMWPRKKVCNRCRRMKLKCQPGEDEDSVQPVKTQKCYRCKITGKTCDGKQPCTQCGHKVCRLTREETMETERGPKCTNCGNFACDRQRPCKTCVERGKKECAYIEQDGIVTRTYTVTKNNIHFKDGKAISEDEAECTLCKRSGKLCPGGTPCSNCVAQARKIPSINTCVYRRKGKYVEKYKIAPFKPHMDGTPLSKMLTEDEQGTSEHYKSRNISSDRLEFNQAFPDGYEIMETPSRRAECGIWALIISMEHQHNIEVNVFDLKRQLGELQSTEIWQEAGTLNNDNFSLDQLQAMMDSWCRIFQNHSRFHIKCITKEGHTHKAAVREDEQAKWATVWIHNDQSDHDENDTEKVREQESKIINHFSGIKHRYIRPKAELKKRKTAPGLSSDSEMEGSNFEDSDTEPPTKKIAMAIKNKQYTSQEPRTHAQAMESADAEQWKIAERAELDALNTMNTFTETTLPPNIKAIPSRLVYKIKTGADGNVTKFKARLVARGDRQRDGIDFDETYASVVKASSWRIMLALAVKHGWKIHQSDIKTAYLNGKLEDEIYMNPPKGFELPKGRVWKLNRALYGLKQAGRLWYQTLAEKLRNWGWIPNRYDHCVWISPCKQMWILFWVDDLLTLSPHTQRINQFLMQMSKEFDMSNEGEIKYYLGINVDKTETYLKLHAETYIKQALARYNLSDIHEARSPVDASLKLEENSEVASDKFRQEFQSKLGTLAYPSNYARPDITFATNYVARYSQNPSQKHMDALHRIYAYLKGTTSVGIKYEVGGDPEFKLYSDSDHAGCGDTRRSTTGWILTFMGGPVSWRSHRQSTVALATCDAEYTAAAEATQEAIYVKGFVNDLQIKDFEIKTLPLFIDNEAALSLSKNPKFHTRTKHIDVKYHFIRDATANKHVNTQRVDTRNNVADILTKGMTGPKHTEMTMKLGMLEKLREHFDGGSHDTLGQRVGGSVVGQTLSPMCT